MEYEDGVALVYVPNNDTSSAIDIGFLLETICTVRSHYIARMIMFAFFVLFGVIGNIALLIVILRDKHLQNAPNILISNLAVADLVYILVMGPIRIEHEIHPCWLKGELACALRYYAPIVCQCTCVYSLVALSRERYSAITQGIQSRKSNQIKITLCWAAMAWIFGVVYAAPVVLSPKFAYIEMKFLCILAEHGSHAARSFEISKVVLCYVLPAMFITFHYSIMARTLIKSTRSFTCQNATFKRQIEARKRLAYLSITLTIFFGIFWLPSYVYSLMYNFMSLKDIQSASFVRFRHFHYYMSLANSSLNPWLVFTLSSSHRKRLLSCVKRDDTTHSNNNDYRSGRNTITLRAYNTTGNDNTVAFDEEQINQTNATAVNGHSSVPADV